ncbi:MAG: S-layer homology domain-containing protein, partial [Selenomonas noxia]
MKKTLVSALAAAFVIGAAGTTFAAANPFSDVPRDHWAYDAVTQLASDGVIEGYGHSRRGGGFFSYNNADGCSRTFVAEGTDSSVFEKAVDSAELDVT